jgi:anti-sigma factor RsiW
MIQELEHEETMVDYLLGRLSPQEGARLEERCLADDAFFDRMLEAENDVVDNYLRGRLSRRDKESFESHYLASPERREKVEFARSFLHTVTQSPPVAGKQPSKFLAWWESVRDSVRGRGLSRGYPGRRRW